MRWSIMTYSLDQQPGRYPVAEYPAIIAAAGAEGINWVSTYGLPPAELRCRSLEVGLEVSCFTFSLVHLTSGGDWRREARDNFAAAIELGAPRVMVVPMAPSGTDTPEAGRRCWLEAVLPELSRLAMEYRVVLTIENFQGRNSPFVTAEDLLSAQRAIPGLRFTLDVGNAATGGEASSLAVARLDGGIEFVHFKDYVISETAIPGSFRGRDGRFYRPAVLGEGNVELYPALQTLQECGYDGWIDVEFEGSNPPAAEGVAAGIAWLNNNLKKTDAKNNRK